MANEQIIRLLSHMGDESQQEPPRNFYIWGFQPHFGMSVKMTAEKLFEKLSGSIIPETFIVAVNFQEDSDKPIAVVEPEDNELQPENFKNVLSLVAQLAKVASGPFLAYQDASKGGETWARREERQMFRSKVREAIQQTIVIRKRLLKK